MKKPPLQKTATQKPAGQKPSAQKPFVQETPTNQHPPIKRESEYSRQCRRERTLRKKLLIANIVLIMLIPFASPHFRVRKIEVSGGQGKLLPQEQALITNALRMPKYTNWVLAPVGRIRRTLETLPFMDTAKVTQQFPNHIVVQLRPREPFAILTMGTVQYEVDAKAYPIRVARPQMIGHLPEIEFQEGLPVKMGVQVTAFVLPMWLNLLSQTYVNNSISIQKIKVDPAGNLCLNMKDGLEVQLGQAEMLAEKTALLRTIYTREPAFGSQNGMLNVSVPQTPACRRRVAGGTPPTAGSEPPVSAL